MAYYRSNGRYSWRPSKAQRREFAIRMQDPVEKEAYEERKKARADKRRASSVFNYETAGGMYVPTKAQYDYCVFDRSKVITSEQEDACNQVVYGFDCNEKVSHDAIHIVNQMIRGY